MTLTNEAGERYPLPPFLDRPSLSPLCYIIYRWRDGGGYGGAPAAADHRHPHPLTAWPGGYRGTRVLKDPLILAIPTNWSRLCLYCRKKWATGKSHPHQHPNPQLNASNRSLGRAPIAFCTISPPPAPWFPR